jgi:uncharacterized protein (TIRG00374 family)
MKGFYRIGLGLSLSLIFILVWFWLVDLDQLIIFFRQMDLFWLGPIVFLLILVHFLGSWRLKILMESLGQASIFYFLGINFIGGVVSIFVPFQGGGFFRAYLFKKKFSARFSTCFAIVLFDYLLGLGVLFLFSFLAFFFFTSEKLIFRPLFWLTGAAFLALLLVLLGKGLFLKNQKGEEFFSSRVKKILPAPVGKNLLGLLKSFKLGFSLVSQSRLGLFLAAGLSFLVFFLNCLGLYFYFLAFGFRPGFWPLFFASAVFSLSNFLPGTPAKIGQYELIGLAIYTLFLGLGKNLAAAVILFSHLIGLSFGLLGGLISLFWLAPKKIGHFKNPAG